MSDQNPPAQGPTGPTGWEPQPPAQPTPPAPPAPQGYPAAPGYQTPGYPAAPGYAQPGYAAAPPKTPGIAITGLVLAIILPLVGLIVSIVALGKTKAVGAGRGLAKAGVIVGAILTVVWVGVIAAIVWFAVSVAGPAIAVTQFNDAVRAGDCQAFFDHTTENFRSIFQVADCDGFDQLASASTEGIDDTNITVTNTSVENDTATVTTTETVTGGGETDTATGTYSLVKQDGSWLVDDATWN